MGQTKRRTARTTIVRIAGCCRDGSAGVARTCSAASYHVPSGTGWAFNGTCAYSRFRFRRGLRTRENPPPPIPSHPHPPCSAKSQIFQLFAVFESVAARFPVYQSGFSALRRPRGAPSAGATCFARLLPRELFYPSKNRSKRTSKNSTPVYQWAAKVA